MEKLNIYSNWDKIDFKKAQSYFEDGFIPKFPEISEKLSDNVKLFPGIYVNKSREFIWPDINNNYYNEIGNCYALKDHIGILSDGTIVPCCLDGEAVINLGNIYTSNLEDIINGKRFQDMLCGFKNNKKCENLCRHCNFLDI